MDKDDKVLRAAVADAIEAHDENGDYRAAFNATLGLSGSKYWGPPMVERY